ncbi:MAG TPA: hypothetical protein VE573_07045 [Nitrososphaeraceae archaeon]|nr:hypothetical protein [Nitrososphaeraceae archaeon]
MKLEKGCDKKNISPEMNRGRRSYRRSWVCRLPKKDRNTEALKRRRY